MTDYNKDDSKPLIELLIDVLKKHDIDATLPVTKKGVCVHPYVVIKKSGSSQIGNFSSEYQYYDFICYAPILMYGEVVKLKEKVKKILSEEFYPRLMPVGQETADYYDEDLKAHMSSVMYRNNVRNKHL